MNSKAKLILKVILLHKRCTCYKIAASIVLVETKFRPKFSCDLENTVDTCMCQQLEIVKLTVHGTSKEVVFYDSLSGICRVLKQVPVRMICRP